MIKHHPRENVRFIDLQAMRYHGVAPTTRQDAPGRVESQPRYGIDWLKFFTWSLAIAFSLSVWAGLLLLALWFRS